MFVSIGSGLGMLGILATCSGVRFSDSDDQAYTCAIPTLGIIWSLVWAVPVVIWGGVDGAMYVGITRGVFYPRGLAAYMW